MATWLSIPGYWNQRVKQLDPNWGARSRLCHRPSTSDRWWNVSHKLVINDNAVLNFGTHSYPSHSLFAFLFSLPASNPENWIYKRLFFPSCFYFLFFCSPCILCLVTLPYVSQEKTQRTGRMLSREKVGGQDKKIPLEQQFHPCPRCNHPSSVQLTRSETQLVIFNKQIGKSSNMRVRYECRLCGWKNEILPDNPDDPHQFWHEDDQKRRPSEPSG